MGDPALAAYHMPSVSRAADFAHASLVLLHVLRKEHATLQCSTLGGKQLKELITQSEVDRLDSLFNLDG